MDFKEFMELCLKKYENKIEHRDLFQEFDKNNVLKNYIPITEKKDIVSKCACKISIIDTAICDQSDYSMEIEMIKFFDGIMKYFKFDIPNDEYTVDNYDILNSIGIKMYIKSRVGDDIDVLYDMINTACSITDIKLIKESIKSFNSHEVYEQAQMLLKVLNDKDTLGLMSNILDFNDPFYKKVVSQLKNNRK